MCAACSIFSVLTQLGATLRIKTTFAHVSEVDGECSFFITRVAPNCVNTSIRRMLGLQPPGVPVTCEAVRQGVSTRYEHSPNKLFISHAHSSLSHFYFFYLSLKKNKKTRER